MNKMLLLKIDLERYSSLAVDWEKFAIATLSSLIFNIISCCVACFFIVACVIVVVSWCCFLSFTCTLFEILKFSNGLLPPYFLMFINNDTNMIALFFRFFYIPGPMV